MSEQYIIVKEPHGVLRTQARAVTPTEIRSVHIQRIIEGMKKTLAATLDGVGLAAPQINEPLQIFIVSEEAEEIDTLAKLPKSQEKKEIGIHGERPYEKRTWQYYVFINPITKTVSRRKAEGTEGCLSVPGKFGMVPRHQKIIVEAYDEHGKKFIRGASNFFARVMQHELDHLQGILFIDNARNLFEVEKKK